MLNPSRVTRRQVLAVAVPSAVAAGAATAAHTSSLAGAVRAYDAARARYEPHAGRTPATAREARESGHDAAEEDFCRAALALRAAILASDRTWIEHEGRAYLVVNPDAMPQSPAWRPDAGLGPDEVATAWIVRSH